MAAQGGSLKHLHAHSDSVMLLHDLTNACRPPPPPLVGGDQRSSSIRLEGAVHPGARRLRGAGIFAERAGECEHGAQDTRTWYFSHCKCWSSLCVGSGAVITRPPDALAQCMCGRSLRGRWRLRHCMVGTAAVAAAVAVHAVVAVGDDRLCASP